MSNQQQIEELKKNSAMEQNIQKFIDAHDSHIYNFKEKGYLVKNIEDAHIIVKVNQNVYESELMNHDICQVIAHTEDGELIVKRLIDNHIGIVQKEIVSFPHWKAYPFK